MSDSCNPMRCSPPGSSVHGILLTRILEGRGRGGADWGLGARVAIYSREQRFVEPVKPIGSCGVVKNPCYSHQVATVEQKTGFLLYECYCFLTVEGGMLLYSTLRKWVARVFKAAQNILLF